MPTTSLYRSILDSRVNGETAGDNDLGNGFLLSQGRVLTVTGDPYSLNTFSADAHVELKEYQGGQLYAYAFIRLANIMRIAEGDKILINNRGRGAGDAWDIHFVTRGDGGYLIVQGHAQPGRKNHEGYYTTPISYQGQRLMARRDEGQSLLITDEELVRFVGRLNKIDWSKPNET